MIWLKTGDKVDERPDYSCDYFIPPRTGGIVEQVNPRLMFPVLIKWPGQADMEYAQTRYLKPSKSK